MRKDDYYEVHALAVAELLRHVAYIRGTILEPNVGSRAISKPIKDLLPNAEVLTNDSMEMVAANYHFDLTKQGNWKHLPDIDWVIGSPSFEQAFKTLVSAHDKVNKGVALLLRLSFLEPTYERQSWLADHPPNKLIVLPRYSFSQDGKTDSVTTAWFVWDKSKPWDSKAIHIVTK